MCYMAKSENVCRHHAGHVVIGAIRETGSLNRSRSLLFFSRRHRPFQRNNSCNRLYNPKMTSRLGFHPVENSLE